MLTELLPQKEFTSSPKMKTFSSRTISSSSAELRASRTVICRADWQAVGNASERNQATGNSEQADLLAGIAPGKACEGALMALHVRTQPLMITWANISGASSMESYSQRP